MLVKPAPGLKVRHPETKRHIPESGCDVPETSYWLRRLARGDVVRVANQIPDSEVTP
jgi:hypothetical protein